MKLLIITNLFPSATQPSRGLFNLQQFRELRGRHALTVVAPLPWVPPWLRQSHRWAAVAGAPPQETIDGMTVHHPRYLAIPVIGRFLQGRTYEWGIRGVVRRLAAGARFDALLATWAYPDVVAALRLARWLRLPLVAKVHGSDINVHATGARRRWITRALQQCETVVCVSAALRERVIALGVAPRRAVLVPNGVDASRFTRQDRAACRRRLGLPEQGRLVVYVGNLVPVKGVDVLVDAFRRPQTLEGVSLAIVGDGELLGALERAVAASGLQARVRFLGARPHEEIPLWMGACDVFCLPSRQEGCPNVVLEAQACGRPVVGTDTGGIPEFVRPGRSGVLVPVADPAALAVGLRKALSTRWDEAAIAQGASGGWRDSAQHVEHILQEAASRRRRVLHVLSYSVPNMSGYTHRSRSIIDQQRALGMDPTVITSARHNATVDSETIDDLTYYRSRVPATGLWALLSRRPFGAPLALMAALYRDILRAARQERPEVIHAHSPVLCGLPALAAARRLGLPCVYEVRALWEDAAVDQEKTTEGSARYALTRAMESFVLRHVNRIIVICEGLKRDLIQRGLPEAKIVTVPNGVDTEAFRPLDGKDPALLSRYRLNGQKVVGFLGSFFAFEGLEVLIRAVPLLLQRDPSIRVLIVGAGDGEAELRRLAQSVAPPSSIVFTGRVPHQEVSAYYSIMDVLVYPRVSKRITELVTPLKPLEAMALRKTVVASDVGGLKELVVHGSTGLLFKAGDAQALADACLTALTDPALARRLAEAGRSHVEQHRQWATICRRHVALYDELKGQVKG